MTTTVEAPTAKTKNLIRTCNLCLMGQHARCITLAWNPGKGNRIECGCPQPECAARQPRCTECRLPENETELTAVGPIVCADSFACGERKAARVEADPMVQEIRDCQQVGAAERAGKREKLAARQVAQAPTEAPEAAPVAPRAATTPRKPRTPREAGAARATSGSCRCCGEPTRGGAFLPGHDARFIGQIIRGGSMTVRSIEEGRAALADKPLLLAKLNKRLAAGE